MGPISWGTWSITWFWIPETVEPSSSPPRPATSVPRFSAYFTVKRQAFAADAGDPVGLYFGTTSGTLFASRDEGNSWRSLAAHLPHIYSVTTGVRR